MRVGAHLYASRGRDDGRNGRDYHSLNEPDFNKREIVLMTYINMALASMHGATKFGSTQRQVVKWLNEKKVKIKRHKKSLI